MRELLTSLAGEGKTVFLSSHMMSEMALIAQRLVVIGRGRLIADTSVEQFVRQASAGAPIEVRSPRIADLRDALTRLDREAETLGGDGLLVHDSTAPEIGELAAGLRIPIYGLASREISLEDAFMQITRSSLEYRTDARTSSPPLESAV